MIVVDKVTKEYQIGEKTAAYGTLREHIDLKVEVRTAIRQALHLVLADQDPDRQEDRLERHDEREEVERVGIEGPCPGHQAGVHSDPRDEPREMDDRERGGARDANESSGTPRAERAGAERIGLELGDPRDITTRRGRRAVLGDRHVSTSLKR
jgi:hypothetical protein